MCSTHMLVETPAKSSVSTPYVCSTSSIGVDVNALGVILLKTRSFGSGFSSSTISCSRSPTRLFVPEHSACICVERSE